MKRVLSLVLALIMVFGTIMPAFAEGTTTIKTSGEMLESYGLIKGTGEGLDEDQPLKRAEMAVILARLNNKEDIANVYAFPSSFTDVPLSKWYAQPVAYAEAQGWMKGDKKGGTFRPEEFLSAQEVNMLMVRVLGYTDTNWEDANAQAEALKIAVNTRNNSQVMRGEIFKAMTTTLDVPKKGENETLGTTLALNGYTSPTPIIPEKLEVVKVITDNLKTIVVEFNQELNKKTVIKDNFKISDYNVQDVKLLDDKMTVVIIVDGSGIPQSKEIKLTIEKIKDSTDMKTVQTFKDERFVVTDVTVPVIESISVIDAKSVKVRTSEPMNWSESYYTAITGLKLDGYTFYGKVTPDYAKHEYVLEFSSVKKEGSYKLSIEGVKDYAGLAAVKKEFSFDIGKDEQAPVAKSAKSISTKEIEVTFDEPVNVLGEMTVNGKDVTLKSKSDDKKVIIATFNNSNDKLDLAATVEVVVKYKGQKDVRGNEVKTSTTLTFRVEDDTTLPTVSVNVEKGNKIVFSFSKSMDQDLGTLRVLDTDKKEKLYKNISDFKGFSTDKWNSDRTVLTLSASDLSFDNQNPIERIIELKGLKDSTVRANLLPMVENSVTLLDTKRPDIATKFKTEDYSSNNEKDTITFYFTEGMDEETMKNLSNYRVESGPDQYKTFAQLDSKVTIKSIASDKRSITFYYEGVANVSATYMVYAIKDFAGNMMNTPTAALTEGNSVLLVIDTVEAKDDMTVEIVFNSEIKTADPSFLKLLNSTGGLITANSVAISGLKVTFTLETKLPSDTSLYSLVRGNYKGISNVYGTTVLESHLNTDYAGGRTVTDKIAPAVVKMDEGKYNSPLTKNFAVIEMSENLNTNALIKSDYIVKLNSKVLLSSEFNINVVNNKYVEIQVLPNDKVSSDGKYKLEVQLIRESNLMDTPHGNKTKVFTKSISDFVYEDSAPTVAVTADKTVVKNGEVVVFTATFNENVKTGVIPQITLSGGETLAATNMAKTSDTVWTLTHTMASAGNVTVQARITGAVDAGDNAVTGTFASQANDTTVISDNVSPTVAVTADKTAVKDGDVVVFTATFNEAVKSGVTPQIELSVGDTVAATNMLQTSATVWTYTRTMANGQNAAVKAQITVATDTAGNLVTGTFTTATDTTVVADNVQPTVNVTANKTVVKKNEVVIFTAIFNEAVKSGVIPKMALSTGEVLAATDMVRTSDTVWTLTHTMAGTGNAIVEALVSVATDAAGNLVTGTFVDQDDNTPVTADNTAPLVSSILFSNTGAANAITADDTIVVTFNEEIQMTSLGLTTPPTKGGSVDEAGADNIIRGLNASNSIVIKGVATLKVTDLGVDLSDDSIWTVSVDATGKIVTYTCKTPPTTAAITDATDNATGVASITSSTVLDLAGNAVADDADIDDVVDDASTF